MVKRLSDLVVPIALVSGLVAAIALSITIGFVGAAKGQQFDWRLCAEIGTALGTLLLAMYTAFLATATRREVRVSLAEQQARDRPIVVATVTDFGRVTLGRNPGESVPTLRVWIRNVGLGPALNLRLSAERDGQPLVGEEVIPVVAVGETITDRAISLSGTEAEGGFDFRDLERFAITGTFLDRTQIGEQRPRRHSVTALMDAGLQDEVRAAQAIADRLAWLEVVAGTPRISEDGTYVEYSPSILNNGPAQATAVRFQLVGADDDQPRSDEVEIGLMWAPSQQDGLTVRVDCPHPTLTLRLTWRDSGTRERLLDGIYPAVAPGHPAVWRGPQNKPK